MWKIFLAAVLLLLLQQPGYGQETAPKADTRPVVDVSEAFNGADGLWQVNAEALLDKKAFSWTSAQKRELRYSAKEAPVRLCLWDMSIDECVFTFQDERLIAANILFFSRGDSGNISSEDFFSIIEKVKAAGGNIWGNPSPEETRRLDGVKRLFLVSWDMDDSIAQLTWSYGGRFTSGRDISFQGEYIRLSVGREGSLLMNDAENRRRRVGIVTHRDYSVNVVRNDDKDVIINNIPMVDQGQKGYCVAATAERVFRYYGQTTDQHMLAQLAETSVAGTRLSKMLETMNRVDNRFRVRHRLLFLRKSKSTNELRRFNTTYNALARRSGKPRISFEELRSMSVNEEGFGDKDFPLDYDVFMQTMKNMYRREHRRFFNDVREYIDKGIPCVWTVILGIIKEKDAPQAGGGHQRLIIGYNVEKERIYFSDSWGVGHEKKSMSWDEAWAITVALNVYLPLAERR